MSRVSPVITSAPDLPPGLCGKANIERRPVDDREGRGRPVVVGTLVEFERWKPVAGGDSGSEIAGEADGRIGDT
jgi:hypothetical protein